MTVRSAIFHSPGGVRTRRCNGQRESDSFLLILDRDDQPGDEAGLAGDVAM